MRRIKVERKGERGSAIVELALCLLGFMMLTMGAMDFGWAVYAYNFCSYASQDAARWASVHGSLSSSPAGVSDVQTYVNSQAVGLSTSLLTTTTCWSGVCPTSGSAPAGDNTPGSTVSVKVAYQVQPLTGLGIKQAFTVGATAQFVINH
jgi:Flp pilus assembly protein TadG